MQVFESCGRLQIHREAPNHHRWHLPLFVLFQITVFPHRPSQKQLDPSPTHPNVSSAEASWVGLPAAFEKEQALLAVLEFVPAEQLPRQLPAEGSLGTQLRIHQKAVESCSNMGCFPSSAAAGCGLRACSFYSTSFSFLIVKMMIQTNKLKIYRLFWRSNEINSKRICNMLDAPQHYFYLSFEKVLRRAIGQNHRMEAACLHLQPALQGFQKIRNNGEYFDSQMALPDPSAMVSLPQNGDSLLTNYFPLPFF